MAGRTWMTVGEAAELLDVNEQMIRHWIRRGGLRAVRNTNLKKSRLRIPTGDFIAFYASMGRTAEEVEEMRRQVGTLAAAAPKGTVKDGGGGDRPGNDWDGTERRQGGRA